MKKEAAGSSRKRRKQLKQDWQPQTKVKQGADEEILSSDDEREEDEKFKVIEATQVQESTLEKRNRLAQELLAKIDEAKRKRDEENGGDAEAEDDEAGEDFDETDQLLRKEVLKSEGRLQRALADKMQTVLAKSAVERTTYRSSHSQSVTTVCVSADEMTCFSGSKDGAIVGWDVETNKPTWKPTRPKDSRVLGLACSSDGVYLASCGDKTGSLIRIWDVRVPNPKGPVRELSGHRDVVTQVVFRQRTSILLSASDDRSVRLYNAAEGSFMEHLFGHYSRVCAIDCLSRERCVSASEDSTVRLWKIPEETHLLLSGKHIGPIDCVKMINESTYVSGAQEGTLALWNMLKRRPVSLVTDAHGPGRWVESLAAIPNGDVIASGSNDGLIRIWRVDTDRLRIDPDPIAALPCIGHVNSLAFAPTSARFLVAGYGQEPRLGRWRVDKDAKNGVAIYRLPEIYDKSDL